MEDFKEMEMARLKGQVEAIKHYYAILIAKNVSKVEEALTKADDEIISLDLSLEGSSEEIKTLGAKLKRTKSKTNKVVLEQGIKWHLLVTQIRQEHRETLLSIRHKLKQVV